MSSSSDARSPVELLADEFLARCKRGERPTIREYCDQHPDLADEIRDVFEAVLMVEDLRPGSDDVSGSVGESVQVGGKRLQQVGDYRILGVIGRGGMGVVYEAEQQALGRRVALKVLPRTIAGDGSAQIRFQREAKAAARMHHTNIVPVFDVGQDGEHLYYAIQLIHGQGLDLVIQDLKRLRAQGAAASVVAEDRAAERSIAASLAAGQFERENLAPEGEADSKATVADEGSAPSSALLPGQSDLSTATSNRSAYFRSVAQIGVQTASALSYAHGRGIIHRDIKPGNLILDTTGNIWVTDFGLAKMGDGGITHTGDILGTVRYMSPERFRSQCDVRADVYALGMTLYELLTLKPAYATGDRLKLIESIRHSEAATPRSIDGHIPRDLETIVMKAIDKDPRRRYQSADEMGEDLQRFVNDEPIKARRVGVAERLTRWCRRNSGIAALGGVLTVVLILVTVASLLAAGYFNQLRWNEAQAAQNERDARHEAELSRKAESLQRQRSEAEKKRADVMLADMYTSRGLLAGDRDAAAEAVLWFAAAADQSAIAEDSRRLEDNRLRARNWMRQATLPVAAMALPDIPGHLEFQPHGDLLLVRSDKEVILWSWRDGKRLGWAEKLTGVCSAQFSPDGASVALGFLSGEAQVRKVSDGELLAKIQHEGQISALSFSPDGKFLAVASKIVRVWDIKASAFLGSVWSHPQGVVALRFNRNGDRLITACQDKRARVFAVEGGQDHQEPLYAPVVHAGPSSPALIDEDRILVTVSGESQLSRWDVATGKPLTKPIGTRPWYLQGVAASPDGNWFATAGYNGPELYAADARQPPVLLGHTNLVTTFVFSPDNTMLLSGGWDWTARLWSLPRGRPLGQPLKHMSNVDLCAWSPDARHLATAQYDGLIRVWQCPVDDPVIASEPDWGERPRLSFDGRLAAPGLWHESSMPGANRNVKCLRVMATATGRPAGADISLPGGLVDSCICGDNLAVAALWLRGEKGQLGVWDVATARARFEPFTLPGFPISVAARPGSGQLAVLCSTGDLLVIDDKTGKCVLELRHEGWAASPRGFAAQVQYTPDGKTLVSLCPGTLSTVNVRDADTGRLRFAPLRPGVDGSHFHTFSLAADSRLLATMALSKNAAQVWDLTTGRALSEPLPHPGDFYGLFSVGFSPNGRYLLTGHKDGQDRYWDWQAGKLACPPMANHNESHDVAITPDGRFALTVIGGRPEMHVWELTTGRRVAPPVRVGLLEEGWCRTLAMTPDGRRALVSFSPTSTGNDLAVVHLETLLSPPSAPTVDLALLAELATAQHIELGDLSGLTTHQWLERWNRLRARNPDLARSFLGEPNRPLERLGNRSLHP
jgi:serine/threonine protein kinase/WD40 repeat protein